MISFKVDKALNNILYIKLPNTDGKNKMNGQSEEINQWEIRWLHTLLDSSVSWHRITSQHRVGRKTEDEDFTVGCPAWKLLLYLGKPSWEEWREGKKLSVNPWCNVKKTGDRPLLTDGWLGQSDTRVSSMIMCMWWCWDSDFLITRILIQSCFRFFWTVQSSGCEVRCERVLQTDLFISVCKMKPDTSARSGYSRAGRRLLLWIRCAGAFRNLWGSTPLPKSRTGPLFNC